MKPGNIILILLVLFGCQEQPQPGGKNEQADNPSLAERDVLVRVNEGVITRDDVVFWLRSAHTQEMTPTLRQGAIDRLVEGELIYQKGVQLGLHEQADYRKAISGLEVRLKAARRNEMMKRVYDQQIAANVTVGEEEVREYFEQNRERFQRELRLGVLSFDTAAEAEAAKARLGDGESFAELGEATEEKWEHGPLSWAKIPLEWHDVVYQLDEGEVSDVFIGERTGVRLFKLLSSNRLDKTASFKDFNVSIRNRIRNEKTREAFIAYLAELKQQADIERLESP